MAATMSALSASAAMFGGMQSLPVLQRSGKVASSLTVVKASPLISKGLLRCQAAGPDGKSPSAVREAVDQATKKEITKDSILRNQEENDSEKQSVFGSIPSSGSFYPRPEIDRRPETGDRSFGSLFAFDGAAPETINGRLAMFGFVWAIVAEKITGLGVMEQIWNPSTSGLIYFVGAVQLLTYASLVPILNGESTDARSWGPFTAKAERWNGRLAMIGFASLIIDEMIRQAPIIQKFM